MWFKNPINTVNNLVILGSTFLVVSLFLPECVLRILISTCRSIGLLNHRALSGMALG